MISYVLPVYNCQSTVARAIESLLNQNIKGEVIVIDDKSTDRTLDVVNYYSEDIIILEKDKHGGAALCRNLGNDISTGDIIAVCDSDIYNSNRSDAITQFFEEFEDKDVFYSGLQLRDKNNKFEMYHMEAIEWDFKSKCPISHPTVAYKRKVAEKVKYKQLTKESDLYEFFLLEAHKEGFKFGGCQTPLMIKVEGNSTRDVAEAKKIKKQLYETYGIEIKELS